MRISDIRIRKRSNFGKRKSLLVRLIAVLFALIVCAFVIVTITKLIIIPIPMFASMNDGDWRDRPIVRNKIEYTIFICKIALNIRTITNE